MNQNKNGQLGNVQVLNSMQAAVQQQRAAGQTTVPIQWVDSWIAQLQQDYAYPYPYAAPYSPYSFYDYFHPVDTFLPLFTDRISFRVTSNTVK